MILANCGGAPSTPDVTISSGVLEFELPSDAEMATFPAEIQTLIGDLETLNETATLTTTMPTTGTGTYTGSFAMGIDDTDTFLIGSVNLLADFATPDITSDLTPTSVFTEEGTLTPSGSISVGGATYTGSTFETGMIGDITVEGEVTRSAAG